jgi:hypothetical protein
MRCRFHEGIGLERVTGIEPAPSAWKAEALPLSYTRVGSASVAGTSTFVIVAGSVSTDNSAISGENRVAQGCLVGHLAKEVRR